MAHINRSVAAKTVNVKMGGSNTKQSLLGISKEPGKANNLWEAPVFHAILIKLQDEIRKLLRITSSK